MRYWTVLIIGVALFLPFVAGVIAQFVFICLHLWSENGGLPVDAIFWAVIFVVAVCAALALAIAGRRRPRMQTLCFLCVIPFAAYMAWQTVDWPRNYDDDITEADVICADAKAQRGWSLMARHFGEYEPYSLPDGFPDVGTGSVHVVEAHADEILRAWEDAAELRACVDELAQLEAIACAPTGMVFDFEGPALSLLAFRETVFLYRARAYLYASEGNAVEGIEILTGLNRVARSASRCPDCLVSYMVMPAVLKMNAQTARAVLMSTDRVAGVDRKVIETFAPMKGHCESFERALLGDYLLVADTLRSMGRYESFREMFGWATVVGEKEPRFLVLLAGSSYRREATLALYRERARTRLTRFREAWEKGAVDLDIDPPVTFTLRNWGGCIALSLCDSDLDTIYSHLLEQSRESAEFYELLLRLCEPDPGD